MEYIIMKQIQEVRDSLNEIPLSREAAVAATKLDECEMWLKRFFERVPKPEVS